MVKNRTGLINGQDMKLKKIRIAYGCMVIFFILMSLVFIIPPLWTILSSFKDVKEFIRIPPTIIPRSFQPEKLLRAWNNLNFTKLYANTLTIVVLSIVSTLICNGMAAYVISKMKPKGSKLFFTLLIATMMIPGQVSMVEVYKNIIDFPILHVNMINTYWPMFLMNGCNTFMIIVYKSFFDGIPTSLLEAAKIDGAGDIKVFAKIVLPLSKPVVMTSIILTFNGVWGDYFWPSFILKDPAKQSIMVAIMNLKYDYPVDVQLAALVFAIVPPVVIFLFLQKYIMEGFTMSGIKG